MTKPIDRQAFLNQLLTELATRTEGALDFWTLLCLAPEFPDPAGFVRQQCELSRSLAVVIRSQLPTAASEAVRGWADELRDGCDEWERAFFLLADHARHTDE